MCSLFFHPSHSSEWYAVFPIFRVTKFEVWKTPPLVRPLQGFRLIRSVNWPGTERPYFAFNSRLLPYEFGSVLVFFWSPVIWHYLLHFCPVFADFRFWCNRPRFSFPITSVLCARGQVTRLISADFRFWCNHPRFSFPITSVLCARGQATRLVSVFLFFHYLRVVGHSACNFSPFRHYCRSSSRLKFVFIAILVRIWQRSDTVPALLIYLVTVNIYLFYYLIINVVHRPP